MKIRRRQLLLGGLATGIVTTTGKDYLQKKANQERQANLAALAQEYQQDSQCLLDETFAADEENIAEGLRIQASVKLTPPNLAYNRDISKILILCSKLATQQYLTGKVIPSYDGNIQSLQAYDSILDGYRQIASFQGEEQQIEQTVTLEIPLNSESEIAIPQDIQDNINLTKDQLRDTVEQVVKVKRKIPVFFGFILSSKENNIMIFRGTQRTTEWLGNFTAFQQQYTDPNTGKILGGIHQGFLRISRQIIEPLPEEIAKKLDPSIPCYVSGHSLGAAIATLVAFELSLKVPELKNQLQLYSYAGPRVGDPLFAENYSQLIPNSYRVINVADVITLMPPIQLRNTYVHIGQEWSFLSQNGDMMPNHVVDTYRSAINKELEQNGAENYFNLNSFPLA